MFVLTFVCSISLVIILPDKSGFVTAFSRYKNFTPRPSVPCHLKSFSSSGSSSLCAYMILAVSSWNCTIVSSGGFRGGRAGRAPPLKFAKHMLYNVN